MWSLSREGTGPVLAAEKRGKALKGELLAPLNSELVQRGRGTGNEVSDLIFPSRLVGD